MTAPSGAVPAPAARQRMGCLAKGCLTSLVVLVLLAGGVAALYRLWLGPKLHAHLERWKEEHPALVAVAGLLGDRGPDSPLAQLGGGGRGPGAAGRGGLPADVAVLPDARAEAFNASPGQVTGYQRVAGRLAEVRARLERGMVRRGWTVGQAAQGSAGGTLLRFGRGERSCRYELLERAPEVELFLRCDPAPAPVAPPPPAVPAFLRRPREVSGARPATSR